MPPGQIQIQGGQAVQVQGQQGQTQQIIIQQPQTAVTAGQTQVSPPAPLSSGQQATWFTWDVNVKNVIKMGSP